MTLSDVPGNEGQVAFLDVPGNEVTFYGRPIRNIF